MTIEWKQSETYQELGGVSPVGLAPARLQMHWACQVLGAAGGALVKPEPGDVHTSLDYSESTGDFTTHRIEPKRAPAARVFQTGRPQWPR